MKTIAILYGGPDHEHEVSIKSAKNILNSINRDLYKIIEVFISRDLGFKIADADLTFSEDDIFNFLKKESVDVVFPVLHGSYGEGGSLQKKLEENEIKFIGSGSIASANAMNKDLANNIFIKNNLLIPKSKLIFKDSFSHNFNYPVIAKPVNEGSSVRLFKFEDRGEFEKNIRNIFLSSEAILLQECVLGREFTCGVIEINNTPTALPVTEIILTKTSLFDYEAKYTIGGCEEITPANIAEPLKNKIQDIALKSHKALNCRDFSRTDMIIDKENNIYVLEINTIPGMTETSFLPAQLRSSSVSLREFIDIMVSNCVNQKTFTD